MATLENYKGIQVVTPPPTGAGGLAINNDFKSLVDWNPRCNWSASVDPTKDDDDRESSPANNYQPGSLWLNVNTGALFLCIDASEGAAVWRGIPIGAIGITAWNSTTDDTPTELFLDGVSEKIVIPENTTWGFEIKTVARGIYNETDPPTLTSAVWESKGAIKRDDDDPPSLIGTTNTTTWKETGASSWGVSITAGSTDELKIEVTGDSDTTIEWVAGIRIQSLTA